MDNFGITSTSIPFFLLHQIANAINTAVIIHPIANTGADRTPSDICFHPIPYGQIAG